MLLSRSGVYPFSSPLSQVSAALVMASVSLVSISFSVSVCADDSLLFEPDIPQHSPEPRLILKNRRPTTKKKNKTTKKKKIKRKNAGKKGRNKPQEEKKQTTEKTKKNPKQETNKTAKKKTLKVPD